MYKLSKNSIKRTTDNASIPLDPANRDYAEYLEWVALGNMPTPQFTAADLLANAKTAKNTELEQAFGAAATADIAYMGTVFQCDPGSQSLLTSTISNVTAKGSVPSGFAWWDKANNSIPMALAQVQGLGDAIWQRGNAAFVNKRTKKDQVIAASDIPTVNAITF
ncbi:MAG: DUF4376 domain-containing protein [Sulfuriferula sp.]